MDKIELKVSGKIVSVEKGSIYTQPTNPVIAFKVGNVKAIAKGDQARVLWDNFLKEGGTQDTIKTSNGVQIEKTVNVSYSAELKDFRTEGVIVDNLSDIEFTYSYKIV